MTVDKNAKICMTLKTDSEIELFKSIMLQNGIKNIKSFTSCETAFENASRTQYDFFLTSINLSDNPGIVLLQRLRGCGNYGLEPHMFVGDRVDAETVNLFAEHDIEYVLTKPFSPERIINKLFYIFKTESKLPPEETAYRNAKSALISGIPDMAWEIAVAAESRFKYSAKLEILLGDILLAKGEMESARKIFESALKDNPESVAAKYKLTSILMKEERYPEAKKILDSLALTNPHHINILENAGLTNFETGHFDLAKKQMEQLQHLDRTNKNATGVVTKVRIERGEVSGLAEELTKTHSEQELVRLLNTAGVKLSKDDKVEEAIAIYQDCLKVIKTDEYAGKVHYNIALGLQRLNHIHDAIKHLSLATKHLPSLEKAQSLLKKLQKQSAA